MVQCDGGLVRLIKVDRCILANIKGIPVTTQVLAVLINIKRVAILNNMGSSCSHCTACG